MRILPLIVLALASCGGEVIGRGPTSEEFDPSGAPPGAKDAAVDAKVAEELLAEAAKRFRDGYPISPGDELRFAVMGQADLTFEARVPSDGGLNYPLIGRVALAGRSLEEVRREVKARLEKDYLVTAEVTLFVKDYARKRVYVLGAVARPLDYEIPAGRFVTLLQAIAQAGGFNEDAAKHGLVISRPRAAGSADRITLPVNVAGVQEGRDRDPLLMPDDIVFVPSREKIFVLGQVAHPGSFVVDSDKGLTASQAIALAGGFTRVANDSNVRLIRRGKDGAG